MVGGKENFYFCCERNFVEILKEMLKKTLSKFNSFQMENMKMIEIKINSKMIEKYENKSLKKVISSNHIEQIKCDDHFQQFCLDFILEFPFFSKKCEFHDEKNNFFSLKECKKKTLKKILKKILKK